MTTTSIGYDGSVDEAAWASLSQLVGSAYNVLSGLGVTVGGTGPSGTDRAVTIAAGTAFGRGVRDTFSTSTTLNAASVGSGSRWDTVVIARNWSTNTSALAIRAGSATKAISSSLNATPGVSDDQPLALIRVQSGQTAVQEVVDARAPSGKTHITAAAPALVRPTPPLGASAIDASTGHYWYASLVGGVPTWTDLSDPAWATVSLVSGASGYTTFQGSPPMWRYRNGELELTGRLAPTTAAEFNNSYTQIGSIPALPAGTTLKALSIGAALNAGKATLLINPTGVLQVGVAPSQGPGTPTNATWVSLDNISVPIGV